MEWTHAGTIGLAAFLASSVECVEALTVVLAVATTRGWRPALAGTLAGGMVLTALAGTLGQYIARIPLTWLQGAAGLLLVLFGMRWLRKALLRASGAIAPRNEAAAFARETASLRSQGDGARRLDAVALLASFKAVVLEGLEVVFIVLAAASQPGDLVPAVVGAAVAAGAIGSLGLLVRQPLTRVPENTLKLAVGLLLSGIGVFWLGEGLGLNWPGQDLAIPVIVSGFLLVSLATVHAGRLVARKARPS